MDKPKTKFAEFDPITASGPPCPRCGAECVITTFGARKRQVWVCGDNPEQHGRMPHAMGVDTLDRLRQERKRVNQAKKDAIVRDFAEDDMDVLGQILADLDIGA